jgi:carbon monoxide dehydrogenase subunit G
LKKFAYRRLPIIIVVAIGIASVAVMTTVISQISSAKAASLEEVKVSRNISAPIDKVWNIISDIDNEEKYWSIVKAIKNINRTNDVTEREVTVQAGPGGDAKTHQLVTVNPDHFAVNMNITEGPITGNRIITLTSDNNATTRVDVVWKINLSDIPLIGQGFAKDSFKKTTEDALKSIAAEAEAEAI